MPLVAGWFILYPLLVLIWLWGASNSGHWDRIGIGQEYRHLASWKLAVGFFASHQYVERFDLTHLWFLHQLLVLYATFLTGRALLARWLDVGGTCRRRIGAAFRAALQSRWQVVCLAAPAVMFLLPMDSWDVDTPQRSLIPHLPTTLFYGYCFTLGWLLYRQTDLLDRLAQRWQANLVLGLVLVLPSWVCVHYLAGLGLRPGLRFWARVGHYGLYCLMMWAFVLGFSGMFIRYRRTESRAWRYIADSSYWVYLVHIPVVVSLQVLIASVELPWPPKFLFVVVVASPLLMLSYHFLVRSTFIGIQLNGRKYPFVPLRTALAGSFARRRAGKE